jgi:hypothetical protein
MAHRTFIILAAGILTAALAAGANQACALLSAAEFENLLGAGISSLTGSAMGTAQMCSGHTPAATILLRLAKQSDAAKIAGVKGVEVLRKMGFQIDIKTFGPMTCSALVPPQSMVPQYGFNTTCSVVKGGQVAAVEITAKRKADAVPIEKLRPLAEKMASRF